MLANPRVLANEFAAIWAPDVSVGGCQLAIDPYALLDLGKSESQNQPEQRTEDNSQ